jgi:hypothetical protein
MKTWVPLVLSAGLAVSLALAPLASADPIPPRDHRGGPMDRPPLSQQQRPPGNVPPRLEPGEYQNRLQRIQDERFTQRQALRHDERGWESSRAQREADHRRQLEGVWGPQFLRRPEVRPELAMDADREARLERMIDLAQDAHDAASEARARAILAREFARHARAMAALRANWDGQ